MIYLISYFSFCSLLDGFFSASFLRGSFVLAKIYLKYAFIQGTQVRGNIIFEVIRAFEVNSLGLVI